MGKIRQTSGGQSITWNYQGKDYELKDGMNEIYDYLGFNAEGSHFPTKHWEITTIVNFGSPQSGKTNFTRAICELGYNIYHDTKGGFECYQTNDLEYTLDFLNREENITNRKKVIFLDFDDAMGTEAKGMNSLNTMKGSNKDFESLFSVVRHKLANEDRENKPDPRVKNGFCVLIFSIQALKRLSTFVRDNSTLCIYKTAYSQLQKEFNEDDFRYLSGITEDSDKHVYVARSNALAKTKNSTMRLYFAESHFQIPVLIPEPQIDPKFEELQTELMKNFDLVNASLNVLKGFIINYSEQKEYSFTNQEINEIICRGSYEQYKNGVEIAKERQKLAQEEQAKLTKFETEAMTALTDHLDLECEDKGVVKGYFIKFCRDKHVDYNKLDYNAIFHLGLYRQKTEKALLQISNPNELTLEILKYRELIANSILKMKFETIAAIEGITFQGAQYRKKQQELKLKRTISKMHRTKKSLETTIVG